MGILTLLFLIIMAGIVVFAIFIATGKSRNMHAFAHRLKYIRAAGLFTMITGILGQLVGLVEAFDAISHAGDISPAMVAGGLKVSLYTPVYGILVYLFTILVWFILDFWHHRKLES